MLTDLLSRALGLALLIGFVTVLLKVFLHWADDGILADADIASFLLHPIGWVAVLVLGAVSIGIVFARIGVLMVIGFGAIEDRQVTWIDALRYVAPRVGSLCRLAGAFVARVGPLTLPFLAVAAVAYWILLGRHDINYYLAERPPEFLVAAVIAGTLGVAFLVVFLRLFAGWLLGVPLVLFEGAAGRDALRTSADALGGRAWPVAFWLVAGVLAGAAASSLVTFVVGILGRLLVPDFGGNLFVYAVGLGVTLGFALLANLGLLALGASLFALLVVRLYHEVAGPGRLDPALRERGTLGARPRLVVPGKRFLGGTAAVLSIVVAAGLFAAESVDTDEPPVVIAHRGASRACPENTMAAFERAIADGADWIELDVQENADGTVIVAHDSDFMKLAGSPMKVWEARDEDLLDLDIGSGSGPEFADERVPTLSRVLETARGRVGVVIELKYYGHDEQLEARVVDAVEKARMSGHIQLMSLKLEGIKAAEALRPDWPRGLLNTVSVGDLSRLDLDFLALNGRAAKTAFIRKAHRHGMKIYVWTVNDPVQMSVMMSRGADGLITDVPDVARQVIELRDRLGPIGRLLLWVAGEGGLLHGAGFSSGSTDA